MKRDIILEIVFLFCIIGLFAIGISFILAGDKAPFHDPKAKAAPTAEYTTVDCAKRCNPLPVSFFLPGYCIVPNEPNYLQRCESSSGTTNIVHISDVCRCGEFH